MRYPLFAPALPSDGRTAYAMALHYLDGGYAGAGNTTSSLKQGDASGRTRGERFAGDLKEAVFFFLEIYRALFCNSQNLEWVEKCLAKPGGVLAEAGRIQEKTGCASPDGETKKKISRGC